MWYIILDVLVTIALCIEVGLRIVAMKRTFWHSWLNILDCVVCGVCVLTLLMYMINPWALEELVTFVVLIIRYTFQLLRLFIILLRHRSRSEMMHSVETEGVDFSSVQDKEGSEEEEGIELVGFTDFDEGGRDILI